MEASRALPPEPPEEERQSAEIRHSLLALIDLSRGLTRARDVHSAVDGLLLNLMGQFGSRRVAIWLRAEQEVPVLVRSHGIDRAHATALVAESWAELSRALDENARPFTLSDIEARLSPSTRSRIQQAEVEVLAAVRSETALLGLLALGRRAGPRGFEPLDLEMVEASLAIAGAALENAKLSGQARESHRQLRIANAELRELDRIKSEFVNNVGHELRTPLAVMVACLDCMKEYEVSAEQTQLLVSRASANAERLKEQVEGLLTLAQAGARTLTLELTEVDLSAFLTAYHADRQPGVSAGLRELHFAGRIENPRARCDSRRLRQVLDELVDNAVKFTPEGSHVKLTLSRQEEEGRAWLKITVEDDGPGIPEAWLPVVFDQFRQVDGSITRAVGGMGIGLSTAKKLAEAMAGRLTVENAAGRGSVFSLLLPPA